MHEVASGLDASDHEYFGDVDGHQGLYGVVDIAHYSGWCPVRVGGFSAGVDYSWVREHRTIGGYG